MGKCRLSMIKFNFFCHTYSFEDINTNKKLKHNNWSCGFMINLVENKIIFIHFSSNNYIHPPTSSNVSIHWKFIKHLSMFHQKNWFVHDFFTSMFFMQHSSFICQASMCQSSIFHPKFKFVYLACHSCSHVHCSCSSIHLIMFM